VYRRRQRAGSSGGVSYVRCPRQMNLRYFLALALGLICIGPCAAAPDQVLVFQDQHFQCTIPGDWNVSRPAARGFALEAKRADAGTFFLHAEPAESERVDVPAFMNAYKNKLLRDGHEIVSEDTAPFRGFPAYSCLFRKMMGVSMVYTHSINFIVNHTRYSLNFSLRGNGDPLAIPDFKNILDSVALPGAG